MLRRHSASDLAARSAGKRGAGRHAPWQLLRASLTSCLAVLAAATLLEVAAYAPGFAIWSGRMWAALGAGTLALALVVGPVGAVLSLLLRRFPWVESGPPLAAALAAGAVTTAHWISRLGSQWVAFFVMVAATLGFAVVGGYAEHRGALGRSATVPYASILLPFVFVGAAHWGLVDAGHWMEARVWVSGGAVLYLALVAGLLQRSRSSERALSILALGAVVLHRAVVPNPSDPVVESPANPVRGVPVVLVVLDTLRDDVLELGTEKTPRLTALAAESTRYTRAVANASWTLPGHASLFSGLPVTEHRTDATAVPGFSPELGTSTRTLAERLEALGYRTSCVAANGIVGPGTGLSRGCQAYENPAFYWLERTYPRYWAQRLSRRSAWDPSQVVATLFGRTSYANASEVTDRALRYVIAGVDEGRESTPAHFLFVNYMDAHRPYASSADTGWRERFVFAVDQLRLLYGDLGFEEFRERNTDRMRRIYRDQVAALDREVGRLLDAYEERGWLDDALVVITADHGQAFWENEAMPGYFGHRGGFEPVVRIPMIIKRPRQGVASERADFVQQSDIAPWVVGGVERGHFVELTGRDWALTEWYPRVGSSAAGSIPMRIGFYTDEYKLVLDEPGRERGPGEPVGERLFDVERTPFESVDLRDARPEVADRLRRRLGERWSFPRAATDVEVAPIDDALRSRLEALGYLR